MIGKRTLQIIDASGNVHLAYLAKRKRWSELTIVTRRESAKERTVKGQWASPIARILASIIEQSQPLRIVGAKA